MADPKSIEIRLAATGGREAAAEVEKVESAVEELAKTTEEAASPQSSPDKLVPAWENVADAAEDAIADATDAIGDAADAGGQLGDVIGDVIGGGKGGGIKGLGGALTAFGGGPVKWAMTAVEKLAGWYAGLRARIDAVAASSADYAQSARATSDAIAAMATPVSAAADALDDYQAALAKIADGAAAATAAVADRKMAMDEQAAAARGLRDALDDLAVAEGRMTEDERADKRNQDSIDDRRADDAAAVEAAKARSSEIASAMGDAMREVLAARQRLGELERSAEASRAEAEDAARAAATGARMKESEIARAKQDGPSLEVAMRRGGLTGLAGGAVDYLLQTLDQTETLERLAEERDKLDAAAKALLEGEEQNAEKLQPELDAARAAMEAANSVLDQLRQQHEEAGKATAAAMQRQQLGERYDIPAIQARQQAAEATRHARERQRAEDERQQAEAAERQRQLDNEARVVAAVAKDTAGVARSGQFDPVAIKAVENAASRIADGTDQRELVQAAGKLADAMERIPEQQQAALAPLLNRLSRLEAQFRNNPGRG